MHRTMGAGLHSRLFLQRRAAETNQEKVMTTHFDTFAYLRCI